MGIGTDRRSFCEACEFFSSIVGVDSLASSLHISEQHVRTKEKIQKSHKEYSDDVHRNCFIRANYRGKIDEYNRIRLPRFKYT